MKKKIFSFIGLLSIDLFSFATAMIIAYALMQLFGLGVSSLSPFELSSLLDYYWLYIIYFIAIGSEGLYTRRETFSEESRILVKALILSTLIALIVTSMMYVSKSLIILLWLASIIIFPTFRYYGKNILYSLNIWNEPILILGNNEAGREFAEKMMKQHFLGYSIIGFLDDSTFFEKKEIKVQNVTYEILGEIKDYCDIADRHHVSIALISLPHLNKEEISALVTKVQQCSRRVIIIPHAKGIAMQNSKLLHVLSNNTFLLELNNNLKRADNQFLKKTFDILLALILLPIILPILIIISILIKIDSKGAIFLSQKRLGQHDTYFQCIKFRTMYDNNDEILEKYLAENNEAAAEWKKYKKLKSYDPRVTRVGNILRKTSLDELAQIINVLKGDMSFVGPRPYLPREREDMGKQAGLILESKPGITGLWQVSGRNRLSFDERVRLDAWYILNWSLWSDIYILVKTIKVVMKREGSF